MVCVFKNIAIITFLVSLPGVHVINEEEWSNLTSCTTPDNETGRCVQLFSCPPLLHLFTNPPKGRRSYMQKFECDEQEGVIGLCCPKHYDYYNISADSNQPAFSDKTFCGMQHADDYFPFASGNKTEFDEYPWVAAVMNSHFHEEYIYCHGALIGPRYVVTSAHCAAITIALPGHYWVRLGDYHSKNKTDCKELTYDIECNEAEDFGIEDSLEHPLYNKYDRFYAKINNIGLIRLNRSVLYSDFIRPICLSDENSILPQKNDIVYSTGWANTKLISANLIIKRKSVITLVSDDECLKCLGPFGKSKTQSAPVSLDIAKYFMCGVATQTVDGIVEGEPVMFSYKNQWYLVGISSWNYELVPENTVRYTKVVGYLDWIRSSIESLDLKFNRIRSTFKRTK